MTAIDYSESKPGSVAGILNSPAFSDLLTGISSRAREGEFDQQRYISQDVIERFKELGIYRALVPAELGGMECSPAEFCELIENISMADGSAGWVASFGMGIVYLAALPPETLRSIYRDSPDQVFAGGIFPPQAAAVREDGFCVNGRWKFSSGCMGADLIGVGIAPEAGDGGSSLPRMAVMPATEVSIEKTWNVNGLIGTGSHDLVVKDVVVPESWTFVRGGPSNLDTPMFRYPTLSFATQVLSVVGLGIARAALDEIQGMAARRASVTGAPNLGQRPVTQVEIAKAEASLRSARCFFYEAIDDVWQVLLRGDTPDDRQISLLRLSSTHAVRVSAEVARTVQMQSGMTGVYRDNPLSRFVNDSQVVTQHAFMGDITWQNAGAVFFGQKPFPGYL